MKGAAWGDFNNDGRPDLYVSRMYGNEPIWLFRNDGAEGLAKDFSIEDGSFTEVSEGCGSRISKVEQLRHVVL